MKNNNFKAFTRLVNPLRSGLDSLLRLWRRQARNPRIPSFANAHSSGFTLAEVLVTLSILGIIAAVTVPSVVRNFQKLVTITKLKIAYSDLHTAVSNIKASTSCRNV